MAKLGSGGAGGRKSPHLSAKRVAASAIGAGAFGRAAVAKTTVNTKAPTPSGGGKSPRSLPQGNGGK